MTNLLSLGKNGKLGEIDFDKLRSGITKADLGIEDGSVLDSIFCSIDNTGNGDNKGNGKLDRDELIIFINKVKELAKNEELSKREAKKFETEDGKLGKKNEQLFEFIKRLAKLTQNIDSVDKTTEVITYDDGHTEQILDNNYKIIKRKSGNKTVTTTRDENDNTVEETEEDGSELVTKKYSSQHKISKIITNNKNNNSETTDIYENDGITPKSRTVVEGNKTTEYKYDTQTKAFIPLYCDTKDPATGRVEHIVYEQDKNSNNYLQQKSLTVKENGRVVSQTIDSKSVEYDGNGNTYIIVQPDERNPEVIAQKFGCTKEKLTEINGNSAYFSVGSRIKVPGELRPDELDGRLSSEDAIRQYEEEQKAKRQAEATARAARARATQTRNDRIAAENEAMGIKDRARHGEKEICHIKRNGKRTDIQGTIMGHSAKYPGRFVVKIGNKYYIASQHDFTILKEEYAKDPKVFKAKAKSVKENQTGELEIKKQNARKIVKELMEAINGINNHDKMREALNKIKSPEELAEVNRLLQAKGYKADNLYSSVEKFMKEEFQRVATDYTCDDLENFVQKWIKDGVIRGNNAINAQARMAARVIIDACDGLGTDNKQLIKGIYMIKAPQGQGKAAAKQVYNKVNSIIASHGTFYGIGPTCKDLIDYLNGEFFGKEIEYLKGILGENDAIQDREKTQAVTDLVKKAVKYAGTDINALKQAIRAIKTPEERKAVEKELEKYIKEKGIKKQYQGQSALQAILYDECDIGLGFVTGARNHKEIRTFNEMLISQGAYTKQEEINIRAEQAFFQIREGGYKNILEAVSEIKDEAVLKRLNAFFIGININGKKYSSLEEFLDATFGAGNEKNDLVMAELAEKSLLKDDNKVANIAFRLIMNPDFNARAKGFASIRNQETANLIDQKLQEKNSSLQIEFDKFNKEKEQYKIESSTWDELAALLGLTGLNIGIGPLSISLGNVAEGISDAYRTNTDSSDNMYVETKTANPDIDDKQKESYQAAITAFEENLNKMISDYEAALDSQGDVSRDINAFCQIYNIGTTRDEIEARINYDKETLRLLKLAAEGKLVRMHNGNATYVSFEDIFKERQSANISANTAMNAIRTPENKNVSFDSKKSEQLLKQAERIGMAETTKDLVLTTWGDLCDAENTRDTRIVTRAIYNAMRNISQATGIPLSLASFGYRLNTNGTVVDSEGRGVPIEKLQEIATQLKNIINELSRENLGIGISKQTKHSVKDVVNSYYEKKMDEFSQEYKNVFGQNSSDDMMDSYLKTINNGRTVVNVGSVVIAALLAPFTAGGSVAGAMGVSVQTGNAIAAGLAAGTVSMGLNAIEHSTDADGYTTEEWISDLDEAAWNAALTAIGMRVGAFAETRVVPSQIAKAKSFLSGIISPNRMVTVVKNGVQTQVPLIDKIAPVIARVEALGFEVTSDSIQSVVQMYCQNGGWDARGFWTAFFISLGANAAGHAYAGAKDVKNAGETTSTEIDTKHLNAKERKMYEDGVNLNHAREGISEPNPAQNGIYRNEKAEFTVTNGKVTKIVTFDGRVITDELKIAKYLDKYNIKLNEMSLNEEIKSTSKAAPEEEPISAKKAEAENKNEPKTEPKSETKVNEEPTGGAKTEEPAVEQKNIDVSRFNEGLYSQKGVNLNDFVNDKVIDKKTILEKFGYKKNIMGKVKNTNPDFIYDSVLSNPSTGSYVFYDKTGTVKYSFRFNKDGILETKEVWLINRNISPRQAYAGVTVSYNNGNVVSVYDSLNINNGFRVETKSTKPNEKPTGGTKTEEPVSGNRTGQKENTNADETGAKPKETANPENKGNNSVADIKTKYGEKIAQHYHEIMDKINTMKTAVDFKNIFKRIQAKFGNLKLKELYDSCISKLEAKAKQLGLNIKALYDELKPEPVSKYFRQNEVDAFLKESNNDPITIARSLEKRGYRPTGANSINDNYKSCVSYYNKDKKLLLTYMFDENGNIINKSMTRVKPYKGGFKRLSDVQVTYDKTGQPSVEIKEGGQAVKPKKAKSNKNYNSTKAQINEYTQRTTYYYGTLQDLKEALEPTLKRFSDEKVNIVWERLKNHQGAVLTKDGIEYTFKCNNDGSVSVTEVNIAKRNRANGSKNNQKQSSNRADSKKQEAYNKYNPNDPHVRFREQGTMNPKYQYVLDMENLPELTLYGNIKLNLNDYKSELAAIPEGGSKTFGREGDFVINDSTRGLSRHHILVTKRNGKLYLKDISANANTKYKTRPSENNQSANRAQNSRQAQNRRPLTQEAQDRIVNARKRIADYKQNLNQVEQKIKNLEAQLKNLKNISEETIAECKQVLGIPEETIPTPEIVKKAYKIKAREIHPDRHNNSTESEIEFKKVNDANENFGIYFKREDLNQQIKQQQEYYDNINKQIQNELKQINDIYAQYS